MKKEKTLVMLPGKNKTPLTLSADGKMEFFKYPVNHNAFKDTIEGRHLYIFSDEELKKTDLGLWILRPITNEYKRLEGPPSVKEMYSNGWRKVIASTNPDLWKKVEPVGDGFLKVISRGVPKIGIDFVKAFSDEYNKNNIITKVMLEHNEIHIWEDIDLLFTKNISAEEFINNPDSIQYEPKVRKNNTVIISPIKKKLHTTEEVIDLVEQFIKDSPEGIEVWNYFDEWKKTL